MNEVAERIKEAALECRFSDGEILLYDRSVVPYDSAEIAKSCPLWAVFAANNLFHRIGGDKNEWALRYAVALNRRVQPRWEETRWRYIEACSAATFAAYNRAFSDAVGSDDPARVYLIAERAYGEIYSAAFSAGHAAMFDAPSAISAAATAVEKTAEGAYTLKDEWRTRADVSTRPSLIDAGRAARAAGAAASSVALFEVLIALLKGARAE